MFLAIASSQVSAQQAYIDGSPLSVVDASTNTVSASLGHMGTFDGIKPGTTGANLYAFNETLGRLYMININTSAFEDSVSLPGLIYDFLPASGNTLYFSHNPTSRIYKMDLSTKTVVDSSVAMGGSGSVRFVRRPGSAEIWIHKEYELFHFTEASMTLTNIQSNVPSNQYIGGEMVFDSTGSNVYYFSQGFGQDGILYKMDATTKQVTDSLITPNANGNLKIVLPATDGTLYMTFFGLWPNEPMYLYRGLSSTMTITDSLPMPHKPFYMAVRPGSQELWISYHYDAKVGVLDLANNLASIDSVTVGIHPKKIVFVHPTNNVSATQQNTQKVTVYPNPGTGVFQLEGDWKEGVGFSLADLTGRTIVSGSLPLTGMVDLSDFAPGVYLLRIDDGRTPQTIRIIKQ